MGLGKKHKKKFLRREERKKDKKEHKRIETEKRQRIKDEEEQKKVNLDLKTGEETKTEAVFHSEIKKNYASTNEKILKSMIEEVLENMAKFQRRGSNWRFEEILKLELHLVEFVPFEWKFLDSSS